MHIVQEIFKPTYINVINKHTQTLQTKQIADTNTTLHIHHTTPFNTYHKTHITYLHSIHTHVPLTNMEHKHTNTHAQTQIHIYKQLIPIFFLI